MNYDPLAELYDLQYRHYRDDLGFYTRLADDYGWSGARAGRGHGARLGGARAGRT